MVNIIPLKGRDIMRKLLDTIRKQISEKLFGPIIVQEKLNMPADFNEAASPYRTNNSYRHYSNCYTYALGIPQHGKATPGKLIHNKRRTGERTNDGELKLQLIYNALIKDGLRPIPRPEYAPYKDAPVIAAFLSIDDDYHFYRQHKDGKWSHQQGYGGVLTDRDGQDALVEDPLYAERGRYKDFVGYFTIPEQGLRFVTPA
jgi:hypothetical protein